MNPLLSIAISMGLLARALAADGYEIQTIHTASSPTASRSAAWKPGDGIVLEVSGMDFTADGKLAVAIRKGEVWLMNVHISPYSHRGYADHEPLRKRKLVRITGMLWWP